jgi:CBS-domain-containing membrane protein
MAGSGWSFLFTPVLAGSVMIVVVALLVNNAVKERRYPTFWW